MRSVVNGPRLEQTGEPAEPVMIRRAVAVVTVVLAGAGIAAAGDRRLFRHRAPDPGPGWTYYGLDSPADTTQSTGRSVRPGPFVPVYSPFPGQFNASDLYRGFPAYPGIGWYGRVPPSQRSRVIKPGDFPQ
jgi:hypothetical protein